MNPSLPSETVPPMELGSAHSQLDDIMSQIMNSGGSSCSEMLTDPSLLHAASDDWIILPINRRQQELEQAAAENREMRDFDSFSGPTTWGIQDA